MFFIGLTRGIPHINSICLGPKTGRTYHNWLLILFEAHYWNVDSIVAFY